MVHATRTTFLILFLLLVPFRILAQPFGQVTGPDFPTDDPVIKNFWAEGMDSSRLESIAHELLDVIGPRLVGTPQMQKAHDWAVETYTSWGITSRNEQYGRWEGWERGTTHIDLLEPRVRTLEGTMMAWSPPTKKGGVSARTIILADVKDSAAFQAWLPSVKGKFVLISQPYPTGRPESNWTEFGTKASADSMKALQQRVSSDWNNRVRRTGFSADTLANVLENAGASGTLMCRWSSGWGVNKIFGTKARKAVVVDLSLEDYTLLYRLTENKKDPLVRIDAVSKFTGPAPAFNTIAEIRGSEKPDEYVMLSAHFDSWESSSGATDNGTGTITMMEAMRLLKKYYPNPKRTILVGHWGSEEQGLNGSRAYVNDHPEVVEKLQALFNQDNGTGRVTSITAQGLIDAGPSLARWISRVPGAIRQHIKLDFPGMPGGGGSDFASFVAAGAPGFSLSSLNWDYFLYTWHTNRDTYDKLVFDDLRNNSILTACLAYMASEDPTFTPRTRRVMPVNPRTGEPREWPRMRDGERNGRLPKTP